MTVSSNSALTPTVGVLVLAAFADVVDATIDLAEHLHLDDALAALLDGDRWVLTHGTDRASWGLGAIVDTPHPDDPGAYPALAVRAWLGPLWFEAEYAPPDPATSRADVPATTGAAS